MMYPFPEEGKIVTVIDSIGGAGIFVEMEL